jgi:hypothetical protein
MFAAEVVKTARCFADANIEIQRNYLATAQWYHDNCQDNQLAAARAKLECYSKALEQAALAHQAFTARSWFPLFLTMSRLLGFHKPECII